MAALLLSAGCSNDVEERNASAPGGDDVAAEPTGAVDTQAWDAACAEEGLTGRLYAITGAERFEHSLLRMGLCPLEVRTLAEDQPVNWVDTGGGLATVVGGHQGHEDLERMGIEVGPSRLTLLVAGEFAPVPGLGSPRALWGAVSREGRIAYIAAAKGPNPIVTWDPDTEEQTEVARGEHFGLLEWGPAGSLATTEPSGEDGPRVVTVFRPDGSREQHDPGLDSVWAFTWDEADLAAVTPEGAGIDCCKPQPPNEQGVLLDMATGDRVGRIPGGWQAITWSPKGKILLLARSDEVGILRPGDDEVTVLGSLPGGPLRDAAWIE